MAKKNEETSSSLTKACEKLEDYETTLDLALKEVIPTELPSKVQAIAGVILWFVHQRSATLRQLLVESVSSSAGSWSLIDDPIKKHVTLLVGTPKEGETVVFGKSGVASYDPYLVEPKQTLAAVRLLAVIPEMIRQWHAVIQEKCSRLKTKQSEDARIEAELVEAEKELRELCREITEAANFVLNSETIGGQ